MRSHAAQALFRRLDAVSTGYIHEDTAGPASYHLRMGEKPRLRWLELNPFKSHIRAHFVRIQVVFGT